MIQRTVDAFFVFVEQAELVHPEQRVGGDRDTDRKIACVRKAPVERSANVIDQPCISRAPLRARHGAPVLLAPYHQLLDVQGMPPEGDPVLSSLYELFEGVSTG